MTITRLDALMREQEHMASTSRQEIEAMQLRKLNALLQREHDRQGFYRDLPASLRSLDDLKALLQKILQNTEAVCCCSPRARWSV